LILKCTDRYRTIHSIQRYGEALEETVLRFDATTRMVTLGESREQEEVNRLQQAILASLQGQEQDQDHGHALTEAELDAAVEGKTTYKRTALRELVRSGAVLRLGKGARGTPYQYAIKDSRFRVPDRDVEQGNKNPAMTSHPQPSSSDACSQDGVSAANHGNTYPDAGTTMHVTESLTDSMPHNTCSHVPDISMEQENKNPRTVSDPRHYEENACSHNYGRIASHGNTHAESGTSVDLTSTSATPGWRVEV
jgi:hypothetical protein